MNVYALLKAAVLGLALSGPATAAVYTGIWDPPYGAAPFTVDLGWRGQATFSVPGGCEPGGTVDIGNAACGGLAAVTIATVELYDTDDPTGLLATIDFDPGSITISTLRYVAGELKQIVSSLSSAVTPGVDLSSYMEPDLVSVTFSLVFTLDGPRLYFNCTGVAPGSCAGVNNDGLDFRPVFNITRVPEPASLALSGLALAGLLTLRRRRGTQQSA